MTDLPDLDQLTGDELADLQRRLAEEGRNRRKRAKKKRDTAVNKAAVAALVNCREQQGRTRADVSRACGVAQGVLFRIEDSASGLQLASFVSVATALGVAPGELLDEALSTIGAEGGVTA